MSFGVIPHSTLFGVFEPGLDGLLQPLKMVRNKRSQSAAHLDRSRLLSNQRASRRLPCGHNEDRGAESRQESHGNYLPLRDEKRGRVYKEGLRRASWIEDHAL
jgi:hypothetical protein